MQNQLQEDTLNLILMNTGGKLLIEILDENYGEDVLLSVLSPSGIHHLALLTEDKLQMNIRGLWVKNSSKCLIVDSEDFARIAKFKWHLMKGGRAVAANFFHGHAVTIGRKVLEYTGVDSIDHKNSNIYDNRKANLRIATLAQQEMNKGKRSGDFSSRYKGVSKRRADASWRSHIKVDKKLKFLGSFLDEVEAAKAYNRAAKLHFGEFACLNEIEESERS